MIERNSVKATKNRTNLYCPAHDKKNGVPTFLLKITQGVRTGGVIVPCYLLTTLILISD